MSILYLVIFPVACKLQEKSLDINGYSSYKKLNSISQIFFYSDVTLLP